MKATLVSSLLCFLACSLTSGCGNTAPQMGTVSVTLTDDATDDLEAFEVDLTGITFNKQNGTTVSVLTRTARIDFTELESLSEIVMTRAIEAGFYSSITLSLDFSNALVFIKGQSTAATVLDKAGAPITGAVQVQVDFAGTTPEVVMARRHLYELDLDLNSALAVDVPGNSVTFCPVIIANVDPTNPKPIAVTGILNEVHPTAMTVVVEKRAINGQALASFTVNVSPTTVYQVDGVVAVGATGLATLGALQLGTARVWIQGTVDPTSGEIDAVAIESGAGTRGNGQDWVIGHVTARDVQAGMDPTLTVLGRSFDVGTGAINLNTSHTVNLNLGLTKVLRRGAGNSLDADDLNVGQQVICFGDLTGTTMDASTATGVVRMLPMAVFGIATGAPVSNVLTLNVTRFDLRPINAFTFNVGGTAEAVPATYTLDVSGLTTTGIINGSKIRAFGWCNPVGVALDDNFTAVSLVDRTNGGKLMLCQWLPPNANAIDTFSANLLTLDVSASLIKAVGDGFTPVTLTNSPAPTIAPLTILGFYVIVQGTSLELHLGFPAFVTSLESRIGAGASVFRITSAGQFNSGTQAFSALATCVILN